ncbi:MCE family protein [Mycolicibacterium sp. XJ870]
MSRPRLVTALATALAALIVAGSAVLVHDAYFSPQTFTAYFTSATAIYPGDEVRVAGVKVGTIAAVDPDGVHVKMTLNVDRAVPVPANAKAVIVAANLLAARYVELTPAYRSSDPNSNGPKMADGATIPIDRTAVPVEWDEVKDQLMRLATELGPNSHVSTPAIARFIDSTANALNGNGDKLRQTLTQLSGVGRILADGSGNIAETIKNLQTLVTALRDSSPQIVEFQGRFATLTSVLDDNRTDLDAALKNLSSAIGDVRGFIADTRDKTSEQVQRLADVTSNLVEHRNDLEQLLHVTPNAIANGYADYNPDTGTILGSVSFNNFSNPLQFFCASIGAVKNATSAETAKICAEYLGPAMKLLNFNNLPFPLNPVLGPAPKNVIYTDPALAPGGAGPTSGPPEQPPAVSAFTGANGDVPPPPGWNQPAPPPAPSVENLLLPAPAAPPPPPEATPTP